MDLIDYIDFAGIFKKVKENQLREYPKAIDYIKELKNIEEDYSYVRPMYRMLKDEKYLAGLDFPNSESCYFNEIYEDGFLTIELSIGGNDSNEGGDNFWGYGYAFKVNLEYRLFEGYKEYNYS